MLQPNAERHTTWSESNRYRFWFRRAPDIGQTESVRIPQDRRLMRQRLERPQSQTERRAPPDLQQPAPPSSRQASCRTPGSAAGHSCPYGRPVRYATSPMQRHALRTAFCGCRSCLLLQAWWSCVAHAASRFALLPEGTRVSWSPLSSVAERIPSREKEEKTRNGSSPSTA